MKFGNHNITLRQEMEMQREDLLVIYVDDVAFVKLAYDPEDEDAIKLHYYTSKDEDEEPSTIRIDLSEIGDENE